MTESELKKSFLSAVGGNDENFVLFETSFKFFEAGFRLAETLFTVPDKCCICRKIFIPSDLCTLSPKERYCSNCLQGLKETL